MIYASVCSGIDAPTVAWHSLGWRPAFFSEVAEFPRAVLSHRWPAVPLHGNFTTIREGQYGKFDLLVGGTPCQDNSIGNPTGDGLDGDRSGLAFAFADLASCAEWVVWENVPNVLSARHAPGFIQFIQSLAASGHHVCWRVMDGRDYGLSDQPRPRIFVVGNRVDPRRAAAVLLEPQSDHRDLEKKTPAAPVLTANGGMAYDDRTPCVVDDRGWRITTPLEWERALGFPDNYTDVPWRGSEHAPLTLRYHALGNSMDVPLIKWLGQRIELVNSITNQGETPCLKH